MMTKIQTASYYKQKTKAIQKVAFVFCLIFYLFYLKMVASRSGPTEMILIGTLR